MKQAKKVMQVISRVGKSGCILSEEPGPSLFTRRVQFSTLVLCSLLFSVCTLPQSERHR